MPSEDSTLPLPDAIKHASWDPTPPPPGQPEPRTWWGRHVREVRWQAELARLLVDPVYQGHGVARGDGTPVVAIPGFAAGDASLSVLRCWLERVGYSPYCSGIWANIDCSDRALDRLDERVDGIHAATGRKVALLGHSRGGHFAKALAHRRPERIAGVITMGAGLDTPLDVSIPSKAAVAAVRAVFARLDKRVARSGCFTDTCRCRYTREFAGAFPAEVPLTSIYSRGDGVVWWEACVVPYARNVEVTGSHVGLAFNRKAYRAVGAALAAAGTSPVPVLAAV